MNFTVAGDSASAAPGDSAGGKSGQWDISVREGWGGDEVMLGDSGGM